MMVPRSRWRDRRAAGTWGGTGLHLHQQQGSANFLKTSVARSTGALKVQPSFLGKANAALRFATLGVSIVQPLALFGATPLFLNSPW
jgi:hypothetical protein